MQEEPYYILLTDLEASGCPFLNQRFAARRKEILVIELPTQGGETRGKALVTGQHSSKENRDIINL